MAKSPTPSVFVIGLLSLEHHLKVEEMPRPGTHSIAESYDASYAGRGGNHAVAIARAGCQAILMGSLGDDSHGTRYREHLEAEGLNTRYVRETKGRTHTSFLIRNGRGETATIEDQDNEPPLTLAGLRKASAALSQCQALLLDLALPTDVLLEASRRANEAGIPVIIRASPILAEFPWGEVRTDYLIVSLAELLLLFGQAPETLAPDERKRRLTELRWEHLIVTRGSSDTYAFTRDGDHDSIPTLPVLPIDPTGAGDAFAGCFAAAIARGLALVEAVKAANCAGALTTLGPGAQAAMPQWDGIERHLRHLEQD